MEDIIAVRVTYAGGPTRYVLTWGRIQDAVDPTRVQALVAAHEASRGRVETSRMCNSLQEAAHTPYCGTFAQGMEP